MKMTVAEFDELNNAMTELMHAAINVGGAKNFEERDKYYDVCFKIIGSLSKKIEFTDRDKYFK